MQLSTKDQGYVTSWDWLNAIKGEQSAAADNLLWEYLTDTESSIQQANMQLKQAR